MSVNSKKRGTGPMVACLQEPRHALFGTVSLP
jgi:hypothetical protein